MPNAFMAIFYAEQAAKISAAKDRKDNLAIAVMEQLALCRPTPTVAEMNSIAAGNVVVIAGNGTPVTKIMRPSSASLYLERKLPVRA